MVYKIPYTSLGGKHRPYLEVVFWNEQEKKGNSKTFAMLDSGADHTIIPFSIGSAIGLAKPNEQEVLSNVSGIAGNLSYIERKCKIYIVNTKYNISHGFDETVWWIYPDKAIEQERQGLVKSFLNLKNLQDQCKPNTQLHKHFQAQMDQTIINLNKISDRLETSVLLGRPFFNNFDFLQFFHKDRAKEEKCFFNYKISKSKAIDIINLKPISDREEHGLKINQVTKKQPVKVKT